MKPAGELHFQRSVQSGQVLVGRAHPSRNGTQRPGATSLSILLKKGKPHHVHMRQGLQGDLIGLEIEK